MHLCVSKMIQGAAYEHEELLVLRLEMKRQNLLFVVFSQLRQCFSPKVLLLALSEEWVVSVVFGRLFLNITHPQTKHTQILPSTPPPPHTPSGRRFPSTPLFSSLSLVIQIYLQSGHLFADISTHAVQPFFLPPHSDGRWVKRLLV